MNNILIGAVASIVICLVTTPVLIPFLRRLKFGQSIREEGPSWHRVKSGTPTMGGLTFIAASLLCIATGWKSMLEGEYSHLLVLALALVSRKKKEAVSVKNI